MAAKIQDKIGLTPTLTPGHGGVFEVSVNGEIVAKKTITDGFPTEEAILEIVQRAIAN